MPDPSDLCNAPACIDAKARLAGARGRFKSACDGLRTVNALVKLLTPIVAMPIWIIVVFALIAAIIGGPIAIVIWALIAVYGISWILLLALGKMAQSLAVSLDQTRTDITDDLKAILKQCPEHCRGDISPPDCNLE